MKRRCDWVDESDPLMVTYHDQEWGQPQFDDQRHLEYLLLETFQAGLSWRTILHKREAFRTILFGFNADKIVRTTPSIIAQWLKNPSIIRHEGKLKAAISNTIIFQTIQKEYGSFHQYLLTFIPERMVHHPATLKDLPTTSKAATAISQDLKKRGMKFVGPTIVYAHLQAIGLVDDHLNHCFLKK